MPLAQERTDLDINIAVYDHIYFITLIRYFNTLHELTPPDLCLTKNYFSPKPTLPVTMNFSPPKRKMLLTALMSNQRVCAINEIDRGASVEESTL